MSMDSRNSSRNQAQFHIRLGSESWSVSMETLSSVSPHPIPSQLWRAIPSAHPPLNTNDSFVPFLFPPSPVQPHLRHHGLHFSTTSLPAGLCHSFAYDHSLITHVPTIVTPSSRSFCR